MVQLMRGEVERDRHDQVSMSTLSLVFFATKA
jgi:hypothetical protein